MKGTIDYLGKDAFNLVLVNDDAGSSERADPFIENYGMQEALRVHRPQSDFNRELLRQTGQIGWGYMVIAKDGTLAGVNIRPHELQATLARACGATLPAEDEEFRVRTRLPGKSTFLNTSGRVKQDRDVELKLTLTLPEGYYTYGPEEGPPTPTRIEVLHSGPFVVGEPIFPEPVNEEGERVPLTGDVQIRLPVHLDEGTPVGHYAVHGTITFMACDAEMCLPPMTMKWFAHATYL